MIKTIFFKTPFDILLDALEDCFRTVLRAIFLYELGKKGAKRQVVDKSQKVADKIVKWPIK
ncbi:hypothetical protein V7139_30905 [Neobacillus drentensis]